MSKMMSCEKRMRREILKRSCIFLVKMCLLSGKFYVLIYSNDYFYKLTINSATYILWSDEYENTYETVWRNIDRKSNNLDTGTLVGGVI